MAARPVAVDLNVDAALLLRSLVGIERYPAVLALQPNIFDPHDQARVDAVVFDRVARGRIVEDGRVQPRVTHWLRCLDRPDIELTGEIFDTEPGRPDPVDRLRISLVRAGDTHVLAIRHDDQLVIQELFTGGRPLPTAAAALLAALGPRPPLLFDPLTAPAAELDDLPVDSPAQARRAYLRLGASPHTASVLAALRCEVIRWAGIMMVEHHDKNSRPTAGWAGVFDVPAGRAVLSPSVGVDGQVWSTYAPGDDAAIERALGSLVEFLPSRSWTTARHPDARGANT
jgi:EspG family